MDWIDKFLIGYAKVYPVKSPFPRSLMLCPQNKANGVPGFMAAA
jgi:hypothetical protein